MAKNLRIIIVALQISTWPYLKITCKVNKRNNFKMQIFFSDGETNWLMPKE